MASQNFLIFIFKQPLEKNHQKKVVLLFLCLDRDTFLHPLNKSVDRQALYDYPFQKKERTLRKILPFKIHKLTKTGFINRRVLKIQFYPDCV